MSWLTNYVRPKIKRLVKPNEVPDNFWIKCPACEEMIFHKELEQSFFVCPKCKHHFALNTEARMEMLFDKDSYTVVDLPKVKEDPLNFSDVKKYKDRLKSYRKATGHKDALSVAYGNMGGMPVVVGVLSFDFMGGSMGVAVGEAVIAAVQLALLQEASLILVTASGGARMQEGMLALAQMVRTTAAIKKLKDKGLPYIVVLTNPTTGGVTASFAMQGDISMAEPKATIGFAGARVIEQTIHEKLPEGFQTSEFLLEHGMLDMVVERKKLRSNLINIISMLRNTSSPAPIVDIKDTFLKG